MKYETMKDATYAFVNEFNAFPQSMIEKLMSLEPDEWHEITPPATGNHVYIYDGGDYGEIIDILTNEDEENIYRIEVDNGEIIEIVANGFEVIRDDLLPMWGTLWQFSDSCDNWWIEEDDGLQKMVECGFRIYQHDEWGYFFGIDGCGYDFYEAHWIPLYKARGLQWYL